MKSLLLSCLLLSFAQCLVARDAQVSNITFVQEGELIKVHYDLQGEADKAYQVTLFLASKDNATYRYKPQETRGDIGKVTAGTGKEIEWAFRKEFPQELAVDDIYFSISAEPAKNSLVYYLLGGGAALFGVVAYLALQDDDSAPAETGSLSIDIPGDM